ncbi:MAG: lipid-A-disaccharide synthase [Rhodospirillales bacterium]|nr:lipid-A-disaccharide synthase [Rhodospirillales bacterium]
MMQVFITAGEASGDVLGARLMAALKKQAEGAIAFHGVGGPLMQAEGLESLFPMEDLSVMGVAEILPRLNLILKRIKQASDNIVKISPDIVVTIDAPDFSFRVVKQVRQRCRPETAPQMIHYVAPTVWAWRPERAAKVARLYDGIMCLFPFEPPYFEREGMKAAFVGHPMLESGYATADGATFRRAQDIPATASTFGVLFGSRGGELKRMGPVFVAVMKRLVAHDPDVRFIVPTLPHLEARVRALTTDLPCVITTDPAQKWNAFAAMDGALATSGTVGLELAVAGVPHVIGYKMNRLTFEIVKRKVSVKYVHLANLLLDAPVVPEFIQNDCTIERLSAAARGLTDGAAKQKQAFDKVRLLLTGAKKMPPAEQAASFVLSLT